MGTPFLCAENFFNRRMFPNHTVVANEQASGFEVYKLADGRRDAFDYWTPTTTNNNAFVTITCDRVRAATFFALDRGHNLAGKVVSLLCSNDNFVTFETVFAVTLPSASAPGSLDDTPGVRTEEGAWVKRFPLRAAKYWLLNIALMGVGLKPNVVGAYLGLGWAPTYWPKPMDDEGDVLVVAESQSEVGWTGRGPQGRARQGVIDYDFESFQEYEDEARLHLHGYFGDGRPTWLFFDDAAAQNAALVIRAAGGLSFPLPETSGYRTTQLPWIEYEPLIP